MRFKGKSVKEQSLRFFSTGATKTYNDVPVERPDRVGVGNHVMTKYPS